MSVLLYSPHHTQYYNHDRSRAFHQKAMIVSYPDSHSNLPYGLITPPSEMRSNNNSNSIIDDGVADPNAANILVPPNHPRYYLRKQPSSQTSTYPIINNNYQNNNYNSYLQVRRRSGSSSTTATSATSNTIARPISPPIDFESRDFNVGEFAATMVCFLWFEPLAILDSAGACEAQLHHLSDDSIPASDFVDFCIRVIRTTAVSKEVALLGLLYIHRLRLKNPTVEGKTGSQWRIFTIALMLGNKILDDNTYTNKTWSDVTKILHVQDIKIMEVEFLSQMRYNLFVSPEQWEEWKTTVSRMYIYHRDCLRQRSIPMKVFHTNIPHSPPVSTIPISPSFAEQQPYMPSSPFRMHFPQHSVPERMASPHRVLPPLDDSPLSASAAVHARVTSRKRSREETMPVGLQPPSKRYQQQYPQQAPLGIQMSNHQPHRVQYSVDTIQQTFQQFPQTQKPPRVSLSVTLPDQIHSPSYLHHQQQYPLQPPSPSYPTSPFAVSPLSPFSTASNYNSLSPYAVPRHRQNQQSTPSQPSVVLENQGPPTGYSSGFSSPYKYLENRYSPYAPVRPVRTLPSQFVPPRMQWTMIPPEELWYQPLGLHGHSGLRRGIPTYSGYNPEYQQQYPQQHQRQRQNQNRR